MAKKQSDKVTVSIPEFAENILEVTVGGDLMLQNRMTEEDIGVIKGEVPAGDIKNYKDRPKKWRDRLHYDESAKRIGFPAEAFLKAMASSLKAVSLSSTAKKAIKFKKDLFRSLHIESDGFDQGLRNGIVYFTRGEPSLSEHMGYIRGKLPIPVYRAQVKDWEAKLRIVYNSSVLTENDVLLLLSRGGRGTGVGAYRAEVGGPYGSFKIIKAVYAKRSLGLAA